MTDQMVTVIIPHYSDLERLNLCLSALEQQTLQRSLFEIIVADNMSPQGEAAVRACVDGRARLVFVADRGAGPARNAGAALAHTPYLAFTDADCLPAPDWLESALASLRAEKDAHDFVGGAMSVSVQDEGHMTGTEAFERIFAFDNRSYVLSKGFSVTANLVMPKLVFEVVGGFRTGVSEDVEWCHRARSLGFRIGYSPRAVVTHPARFTWQELRTKWRRLQSETAALTFEQPWGRLRWFARAWLLPLSIGPHTIRLITDRTNCGFALKWRAWIILIRLRLWRFVDALRLLLRPTPTAKTGTPRS